MGGGVGGGGAEAPAIQPIFHSVLDTCYTGYVENVDTQNTRNVAVKVPADLYALIKTAAHRREMTLADFVRVTLREAAEFYVKS